MRVRAAAILETRTVLRVPLQFTRQGKPTDNAALLDAVMKPSAHALCKTRPDFERQARPSTHDWPARVLDTRNALF